MGRIDARSHPSMKAGPGPISRGSHQAVFDWIEVHVVEMTFVVVFVFNSVFPVFGQPHATSTVSTSPIGNWILNPTCHKPLSRKRSLDPGPSPRIVVISSRQRPYRMKMVGQKNNRSYGEGVAYDAFANCFAKQSPCTGGAKQVSPSIRYDCEEVGTARYVRTSPVRHRRRPAQRKHSFARIIPRFERTED